MKFFKSGRIGRSRMKQLLVIGLTTVGLVVTAGSAAGAAVHPAMSRPAAVVAPRTVQAAAASTPAPPGDHWAQLIHAAPDSLTVNNLFNANTGYCMDDSFTYHLRAIPCGGNCPSCQQWTFVTQNGTTWAIHNGNTSACVDDSFTYHLRSYPCGGNCPSCQQWKWLALLDSSNHLIWMTFVNTNTNGCIDDSSGFGLRSYTCNYTDTAGYQGWHCSLNPPLVCPQLQF